MAAPAEATGRAAVRELLAAKYPAGSAIVLERVSDGAQSGGLTFHRAAAQSMDGPIGLRGTMFFELDASGQIEYVREGAEPIWKAGTLIETLLNTVTQLVPRPPKEPPSYTPSSPTGASAIVRYLWEVAYPNGAEPTEALRFFADDLRYEDFNYEDPFLGLEEVTAFVTAFDIPGVEFVPLRISEGERACCFTWKVVVNGEDGPQGISFYECQDDGKIGFIRDIPAPSIKPPPLTALASKFDPVLGVFMPREA